MTAALVLDRLPGGSIRLRQPIPQVAVLTIPTLLSATTREWIIPAGCDQLEVATHVFVVTGWDNEEPPGLIVEHACCGAWHR